LKVAPWAASAAMFGVWAPGVWVKDMEHQRWVSLKT